MLLSFSVENYKVFKDRTTLSLEASADKDHIDNYSIDETHTKKYKVLKASMIYGANASGKTKLFEAFQLMGRFVRLSHTFRDNYPLEYCPHPGYAECSEKPTSFEVDFISCGIRFVYGFSYNQERITEEHLHIYPKGKEALVFKRDMDDYTFTTDKIFQIGNSRRVKHNTLYVSVSSQFNHEASMLVVGWFYDSTITLVNAQTVPNTEHLLELMNKDSRFTDYVSRALRIADFGIDAVYDRNHDRNTDVDAGDQSRSSVFPVMPDIWVKHRFNDVPVEFPLAAESSGTIRFLAIIGPVIDALLNGKVLIIDEMDLSFHSDICRWIVGLFLDPEENRYGAQLIFNTHDVELLDLNRVRRDQIWFVSKDYGTSVATLGRLSDIKGIRKDLDIKKAYVNGSFGAKPFIEPSALMG